MDKVEVVHDQTVTAGQNASEAKPPSTERQKKLAGHDPEAYMQQIGVDMNRLKLIEDLALTLKEGGISDEELQDYIQRQRLLNDAAISLDTLVPILEKAKVPTSQDQGEELLRMLYLYGNLGEVIKSLRAEVLSLGKEAEDLKQQAKLKGKIEAEIALLNSAKASLESNIVQLYSAKKKLDDIQSEVSSLAKKKTVLEQQIAELESHKNLLSADIRPKQQNVSDLKESESKGDDE